MLKDISPQSGPELSNFNWEDPQSNVSSNLSDSTFVSSLMRALFCPTAPPHILIKWLILFIFIIKKIPTHNATHNETSDQNRVYQGLLCLIPTAKPQDHGLEPPIPGPRVSDHGPLVLAF